MQFCSPFATPVFEVSPKARRGAESIEHPEALWSAPG